MCPFYNVLKLWCMAVGRLQLSMNQQQRKDGNGQDTDAKLEELAAKEDDLAAKLEQLATAQRRVTEVGTPCSFPLDDP